MIDIHLNPPPVPGSWFHRYHGRVLVLWLDNKDKVKY